MFDAIIIGGGFYGAVIAVYLVTERGFNRVVILEKEGTVLTRASYNNQARVHNGYHYPRSYTTAYRSRINCPRFVRDFPDAIRSDFTKLYAIARRNSKVSAKQFERFCGDIGAPLEVAPLSLRKLFNPALIEETFLVEEYAFDATRLRAWAIGHLEATRVDVRLGTRVTGIFQAATGIGLEVECATGVGRADRLAGRFVFNCTYSGLNQIAGEFLGTRTRLKHEIAEIGLMAVPPVFEHLGITLMDGAFFSMMPFPARGLHSLSHVRYTPHLHWVDQPGVDPYQRLETYVRDSRVYRMVRDVARYMPVILNAQYIDSLFEIKTVLVKNEGDDGRPILYERHQGLPGCYSILGGKIDNIYDVLNELDKDPLLRG